MGFRVQGLGFRVWGLGFGGPTPPANVAAMHTICATADLVYRVGLRVEGLGERGRGGKGLQGQIN